MICRYNSGNILLFPYNFRFNRKEKLLKDAQTSTWNRAAWILACLCGGCGHGQSSKPAEPCFLHRHNRLFPGTCVSWDCGERTGNEFFCHQSAKCGRSSSDIELCLDMLLVSACEVSCQRSRGSVNALKSIYQNYVVESSYLLYAMIFCLNNSPVASYFFKFFFVCIHNFTRNKNYERSSVVETHTHISIAFFFLMM